ncbi:MAG: sigma-54 dependent transcriptional regulator [Brevinematales bacterium]
MKYRVLVVDDEEKIRETISDILLDEGYDVISANDGEEAVKKIMYEDIDAVLLDVMLPKKGGMDVLDYIHSEFPLIPALIISGHGDIKMAVEAMKKGAYDFLEKPLAFERILNSIRNAVKFKELQMENMNLKSKIEPVQFIGKSRGIQEIMAKLPQIAQSDASVLITGENGTGKELVARMIHSYSLRKDFPFIGINCAAIPETLIESELFGHEKGAFTGAFRQKKGKFESAHRGTLFLDEIGDLSLAAQAKVLRAVQEKEIERVGGNDVVKVDARLITATNKDLTDEIRQGNFRQDLFYRLNVIPILIPPLRERKDDIELLIQYYIDELATKRGKSVSLSKAAMHLLENRNWPGNVRELRNFIERLIILNDKTNIDAEEVMKLLYSEENIIDIKYEAMDLKEAKHDFEKKLILNRLIRMNNNITRTAQSLSIERTYLHRKIKELKIDTEIELEP